MKCFCTTQAVAQMRSQHTGREGEVFLTVGSVIAHHHLTFCLNNQAGQSCSLLMNNVWTKHPLDTPSIHHTHRYVSILLLLGCWRCFQLFDEFLAAALSLPAECVAASPPYSSSLSFPLVNTIPPSIRPEAGARQGPIRPSKRPLGAHTLVFGQQWRPLIYYIRSPNSQLGSVFSAGSKLYCHMKGQTKHQKPKSEYKLKTRWQCCKIRKLILTNRLSFYFVLPFKACVGCSTCLLICFDDVLHKTSNI